MAASLLLQYIIVVLAVLVSAGVVMYKQFPNATRRLRVAVALPLLRAGRPAWMRALAKKIAPPGQGGGHDCGGCNGCG
jgi:hypothetical protein